MKKNYLLFTLSAILLVGITFSAVQIVSALEDWEGQDVEEINPGHSYKQLYEFPKDCLGDDFVKGFDKGGLKCFTPSGVGLWGGSATGNIWSANSGNVGIGTNTPQAKLDVDGNIYFTGHATDREIKLYSMVSGRTGGNLSITAGTGYLSGGDVIINGGKSPSVAGNVILANTIGNVGIGTVSPNAKLRVDGVDSNTGNAIAVYVNSDLGGSGIYVEQDGSDYAGYFQGKVGVTGNLTVGGLAAANCGTDNNIKVDASGKLICAEDEGGQWKDCADGIFYNGGNVSCTNGKIGIGTVGEINDELEVNGNISLVSTDSFGGTGNRGISFYGEMGGSSAKIINVEETLGKIGLSFHTTDFGPIGLKEQVRISADGNVGIGIASPNAKLRVDGVDSDTGNAIAVYVNSDLGGSGIYVEQDGSDYAGYFQGKVGVSGNLSISSLGNCSADNEVLTTGENGLLICVEDKGGFWEQGTIGNDIFYNEIGGNVGIGKSTDINAKLDVAGAIKIKVDEDNNRELITDGFACTDIHENIDTCNPNTKGTIKIWRNTVSTCDRDSLCYCGWYDDSYQWICLISCPQE